MLLLLLPLVLLIGTVPARRQSIIADIQTGTPSTVPSNVTLTTPEIIAIAVGGSFMQMSYRSLTTVTLLLYCRCGSPHRMPRRCMRNNNLSDMFDTV